MINTNIVASTRMHGRKAAVQDKLVGLYQKRNHGPEQVAAAIADAVLSNRAFVPMSPEA